MAGRCKSSDHSSDEGDQAPRTATLTMLMDTHKAIRKWIAEDLRQAQLLSSGITVSTITRADRCQTVALVEEACLPVLAVVIQWAEARHQGRQARLADRECRQCSDCKRMHRNGQIQDQGAPRPCLLALAHQGRIQGLPLRSN